MKEKGLSRGSPFSGAVHTWNSLKIFAAILVTINVFVIVFIFGFSAARATDHGIEGLRRPIQQYNADISFDTRPSEPEYTTLAKSVEKTDPDPEADGPPSLPKTDEGEFDPFKETQTQEKQTNGDAFADDDAEDAPQSNYGQAAQQEKDFSNIIDTSGSTPERLRNTLKPQCKVESLQSLKFDPKKPLSPSTAYVHILHDPLVPQSALDALVSKVTTSCTAITCSVRVYGEQGG